MGIKRIGVLTSGGDAPGLNAAIKGVVWAASEHGVRVTGILDGWLGLLDGRCDEAQELDPWKTRTWDREGGTNIGSSRTNPLAFREGEKTLDRSAEAARNVEKLGIDVLVALGGEDTMGVAKGLCDRGVPVVGIPKTIDKDLAGTDYTIGFDTALSNCVQIIDRARTPAGSHHWVQVIEVMGRHAGHLAFWSGVAGGAYIILVPEHPFSLEKIYELLERRLSRQGREHPRYAVLVVAEGARREGGDLVTVDSRLDSFGHVHLGGVGTTVSRWIRSDTPWDARAVALGHPQRGGAPTPVDRSVGLCFGAAAARCAVHGRWGVMVSLRGAVHAPLLTTVDLADVAGKIQYLDVDRFYDPREYNIALPQFGDGKGRTE
jgi:6-phosphofructokinase 1